MDLNYLNLNRIQFISTIFHLSNSPLKKNRRFPISSLFSILTPILLVGVVVSIVACGGGSDGGGSGNITPANISISGTVSAPNGLLAFHKPTRVEKMVAFLFFGNATAAISGVATVGAGVSVDLIQVDADGNQVGDTIASAATDANGHYQLTVPAGFSYEPGYLVRASGATEKLDARVIGSTLNIDPVSDAASEIVTLIADDLTLLTTSEIEDILSVVGDVAQDVSPAGLSAAQLSAALIDSVMDQIGPNNLIHAVVATGEICGHVETAGGAPLAGIRMIARDFDKHFMHNKTKTDVNGDYCMNVPDGDYIVGAINQTSTSFHASEWWSSGGNSYDQKTAEKITVTGNSAIADFDLTNGARITGTVKAGAGGLLSPGSVIENVDIMVSDYENNATTATQKTKGDGKFTINVIPGSYLLSVTNETSQMPYASQYYDDSGGTNDINEAQRITLSAGETKTADFVLPPGHKISGQVLEAPGGDPVAGIRVRVSVTDAGFAANVLSGNSGNYQLWVAPDSYNLSAYGSQATVDLTSSDDTADFIGPVGTVTGMVRDADGNPAGRIKVILHLASDGSLINFELSEGSGAFTLYSAATANTVVEFRIDEERAFGSSIYLDQTILLSGTPVAVTVGSNTDLGAITLPTVGVPDGVGLLRGTVTESGIPVGNATVQVRDGGLIADYRFVTATTRGDGTYVLSLPAGTYDRVRATGPGGTGINADNVTISDNVTTTRNFNIP